MKECGVDRGAELADLWKNAAGRGRIRKSEKRHTSLSLASLPHRASQKKSRQARRIALEESRSQRTRHARHALSCSFPRQGSVCTFFRPNPTLWQSAFSTRHRNQAQRPPQPSPLPPSSSSSVFTYKHGPFAPRISWAARVSFWHHIRPLARSRFQADQLWRSALTATTPCTHSRPTASFFLSRRLRCYPNRRLQDIHSSVSPHASEPYRPLEPRSFPPKRTPSCHFHFHCPIPPASLSSPPTCAGGRRELARR